MSETLFFYQCSMCFLTAATTVRVSDPPPGCAVCRRYMKLLYRKPVETEAERAIVGKGLVFSPFMPKPKPKCDTCKQTIEGDVIHVQSVGRFCSEPCMNAGLERHHRWLEKLKAERDARHRKTHPWLYSEPKEQSNA